MNVKWQPIALAFALLTSSAWAQTANQPLNLKLPPTDLLPASGSTAAAPASSSTASKAANSATAQTAGSSTAKPGVSNAPGVYYGDTSGNTYHSDENAFAPRPPCDDSTYNDAQVHGSLSTGVVSASHGGSGSYEGGEVNITKNTGSCDHPTGAIGVSIGVSQGQFHGRGF